MTLTAELIRAIVATEPKRAWVVLRCANASTLKLVHSLQSAGLETWTPTQAVRKRAGEQRSRATSHEPVLPSFAFAHAGHLPDLLELSNSPVCPHPGFWVFRHYGQIPVIADAALDPLRIAEQRGQSVSQVRFTRGDPVRYSGAGFEGLSGVVERTQGRFSLVLFKTGGREIEAKIETALLLSTEPSRRAA